MTGGGGPNQTHPCLIALRFDPTVDQPNGHEGLSTDIFRFRISGLGFQVPGFESRISDLGLRVSGLGSRVSGFGYLHGDRRPDRFGFLGCRLSGLAFRSASKDDLDLRRNLPKTEFSNFSHNLNIKQPVKVKNEPYIQNLNLNHEPKSGPRH